MAEKKKARKNDAHEPSGDTDPQKVEKKADAILNEVDELLEEKKPGDEHYPGDALRDRINLRMNLPRRT